jgi:hypothetical protein
MRQDQELLAKDFVESILSESHLAVVRERAVWTLEWFLTERGEEDKDAEVFRNYLLSLQALLLAK